MHYAERNTDSQASSLNKHYYYHIYKVFDTWLDWQKYAENRIDECFEQIKAAAEDNFEGDIAN